MTIDGWCSYSAISVDGDFVTLINPVLKNPDAGNSGGIRVTGGTGFRCHGGAVASGGDAAIQFSPTGADDAIADGAFIGTTVTANDGRLMLVGSQFGDIDDVRFIGITGLSYGGNLIQVQCFDAASGPNPRVRGVLFRDVAVRRAPNVGLDDGINIYDFSLNQGGGISDVCFENVTVANTGRSSLRIGSDAGKAIAGVRWRIGRIAHTAVAGTTRSPVELDGAEGALFERLRITGGADAPAVLIGATHRSTGVVFSDVTLSGLLAGQVGVGFGLATACGWQRGTMTGNAAAVPASFGTGSDGCFLLGANLSAVTAGASIAAGASGVRIGDNHGSSQRSPVGIGAAVAVPMVAQAAAPVSSAAALISGGGGALNTLVGGAAGDLIVLAKDALSPTDISVKDKTAAGNLQLKGNAALAATSDTLLLRRGAADWAELARSANG